MIPIDIAQPLSFYCFKGFFDQLIGKKEGQHTVLILKEMIDEFRTKA